MKKPSNHFVPLACSLALGALLCVHAQPTGNPPPGVGEVPPPGDGPGEAFGGPGGPPDFFLGGPPGPGGGPMQADLELVTKFDRDGNGWLDAAERKAAREGLAANPAGFGFRRGGGGRPGFGGFERDSGPVASGPKVTPDEVPKYPDRELYDPDILRTLFLEFENADWEKELADFKNTNVEVPARLTVDGRTYEKVGVRFRGMSSYMMISEGRKRSLNLSLDLVDKKQQIGGYRTLNLLNSHEDPTFLRAVLSLQVMRAYLPAPKANFVRVVINGESWGIYASVQQFNKDFTKEFFGSTKGARWKVPGSPGGRGSLAYLGDDPAAYRGIYEIKSKDEPKAWAELARLCRVLSETPADRLEQALAPLLDLDGALKFLALENVLINNDGYWIRSSDYSLYQDDQGRFHVIPHDANETFAMPGGPGFGGGPPGGFGPGQWIAGQWLTQGDKDGDRRLSKDEFTGLAGAWFDTLDPQKTDRVNQEQFVARVGDLLPGPVGLGPRGGGPGGPGNPGATGPAGERRGGGFGPARFLGPGLFAAVDGDKDGVLHREEFVSAFGKWAETWDAGRQGAVDEDALRAGLNGVLPGPGGPGGPAGMGGPGFGGGPRRGGGMAGGGARINGVELDPLYSANDPGKPLLSKLLAVPALRTRYLAYVRDIAEQWLDWEKLGPIARKYHQLIAADVKSDPHKLDSTEAFEKGLTETVSSGRGPASVGLKAFCDQRRAYLLGHAEVKKATP